MKTAIIECETLPAEYVDRSLLQYIDSPVRLSICIATYNRSKFIAQTLDSILAQLQPGIELLIVDGASSDNTEEVVSRYLARRPSVRYIREDVNSGIDVDYDKAVSYAKGDYCWLMTDDDILKAGAVQSVMDAIEHGHDLVVLNSDVWNSDYSSLLTQRFANVNTNTEYLAGDIDKLFVDAAGALSFIGCVVIRRSTWEARARAPYYGTLFIHFGVIFQPPTLRSVLLIADPLIAIRYGNAMWTPRGFEIWMFKWPQLIWSFKHVSVQSRSAVSTPEPWRQFRKLLLYRAVGGYGMEEYQRFLKDRCSGFSKLIAVLAATIPSRSANALASIYCLFFARRARTNVYDLARSSHSTCTARTTARVLGIGLR
jgi:abequosyltransferase